MALLIVIKSVNIYNNECVVSLMAKNNQFCFLLKYISDRTFTFFIFTRVKELNLYQSILFSHKYRNFAGLPVKHLQQSRGVFIPISGCISPPIRKSRVQQSSHLRVRLWHEDEPRGRLTCLFSSHSAKQRSSLAPCSHLPLLACSEKCSRGSSCHRQPSPWLKH